MTTVQFVVYLKHTLVPDLRESGRVETAQDIETACSTIMELLANVSIINTQLKEEKEVNGILHSAIEKYLSGDITKRQLQKIYNRVT